jgi:hypothetical protein
LALSDGPSNAAYLRARLVFGPGNADTTHSRVQKGAMVEHLLIIDGARTHDWLAPAIEVLQKRGSYQISRASMISILNSKLLLETKFACIVCFCARLERGYLTFLRIVSKNSSESPIVVCVAELEVMAFRRIREIPNVVAMQNPPDQGLFAATLEKLAAGERSGIRQSPRFLTDEPVRALELKSGLLLSTRVRNYSLTGAFLEYQGISLKVGDRLQLNLAPGAPAPRMDALVDARVVWVRPGDGPQSAARGVGVEFMQ